MPRGGREGGKEGGREGGTIYIEHIVQLTTLRYLWTVYRAHCISDIDISVRDLQDILYI